MTFIYPLTSTLQKTDMLLCEEPVLGLIRTFRNVQTVITKEKSATLNSVIVLSFDTVEQLYPKTDWAVTSP